MATRLVPSALKRKRSAIEAVIASYQARIELAKLDLAHIDRALAIFEPKPGAPVADYFEIGRLWRRGEIVAVCREALAAEGPLDTGELAERVIAAKGLQEVGPVLRRRVTARVARAMANAKIRGLVAGAGKRKSVRVWSATFP